MLFILAMEPLQGFLEAATRRGILSPLAIKRARIRCSLYADDAALFLNPYKDDLEVVQGILYCFGDISGLKVNLAKSAVYPIKCEEVDLQQPLEGFGGDFGAFPCRYLGLSLRYRKPRRVEVQPILDKMSGRLRPWKGKLMNRPARLQLANSLLSSLATYFVTCFAADKWAIKKMNKIKRNFL